MKWIMGAHQTEVGEAASWGRAAEAAAAWASICSWTLVFRAPGNFWTLFYLLISCVCTIRGSFGPALRHSALRARNETEWIIRGLLTPAERNQNFRCQCQSQSQKANWSNSQQTKKKCNYFDKNDRLLSFCGYWEPIYVPLHSGGREVQGRQTWSIIFCNMYDSAGSFLNFFCHLNWVKEAIQFRKYVLLGKCLDVLK